LFLFGIYTFIVVFRKMFSDIFGSLRSNNIILKKIEILWVLIYNIIRYIITFFLLCFERRWLLLVTSTTTFSTITGLATSRAMGNKEVEHSDGLLFSSRLFPYFYFCAYSYLALAFITCIKAFKKCCSV